MESIYPKTNDNLWKYADIVGTEAIETVKKAINLSDDAIMYGFDTATVCSNNIDDVAKVKYHAAVYKIPSFHLSNDDNLYLNTTNYMYKL